MPSTLWSTRSTHGLQGAIELGKSNRIIVVGAGISGLATAHSLSKSEDVTVFESSDSAGGTISSIRRDGFLIETGPNGFLDSRRETLDLCRELGLEDELLPADPAAENRFTVRRGALVALPSSPMGFLASPALSLRGRLRTLAEGLRRKRQDDDDETVFEFARRRVGRECAERLVDAFITGVYAGDSTKLSAHSTIPRLVEIEARHGSLTRGFISMQRAKKEEGRKKGSPAGPAGRLTSFHGGMQVLIDRLVERIGSDRVHFNRRLAALERTRSGWRLTFVARDGEEEIIDCKAVVSAIPAYALSRVVGLEQDLAKNLDTIAYAPVAVVALGFERGQIDHPLDGFGFVACGTERISILGNLWTSSIFPNRAPENMVLLRTMVGGTRSPERTELNDQVLTELVRDQLDRLMGVTGDPKMVNITKWQKAIPQYHIGHAARLKAIDEALKDLPGLFLTGNAYRGVGINDCVIDSMHVADQVFAYRREG